MTLLPGAKLYRDTLDFHTRNRGWASAAAVVTVFIEGTSHERALFVPEIPARTPKTLHGVRIVTFADLIPAAPRPSRARR